MKNDRGKWKRRKRKAETESWNGKLKRKAGTESWNGNGKWSSTLIYCYSTVCDDSGCYI